MKIQTIMAALTLLAGSLAAGDGDGISVREYDALEKTARPQSMFALDYCKQILKARAAEAGAWKDDEKPTLTTKIAEKWPVVKTDLWYGGRRTIFTFKGHEAWIVEPPPGTAAAKDAPWTWTMQWATAFVPRTGVPRLLELGWRHVTLMQYDERMTDKGIELSKEFQAYLVNDLGFSPKANLIGLSWGGFFTVRYAAAHPENVDRIYLDAPLLSFENHNVDEPWKSLAPATGWRDDPRMPVNMAPALAAAKIPILLLYGKADKVVVPALNCERFVAAYKAAGGTRIKVLPRGNYAHHPHGSDAGESYCFFRFNRPWRDEK